MSTESSAMERPSSVAPTENVGVQRIYERCGRRIIGDEAALLFDVLQNAIVDLEAALREKDDIIQAQYAEIAGLKRRLELAVRTLNEISGIPLPGDPPTSSNIGHG